jgi:hypothetical protein
MKVIGGDGVEDKSIISSDNSITPSRISHDGRYKKV